MAVPQGSPASCRATLSVRFDGEEIHEPNDLARFVTSSPVDSLELAFLRNGVEQRGTVILRKERNSNVSKSDQSDSRKNPADGSSPTLVFETGTPNDQTGRFVAAVLGSTEDVWTEIFAVNGRTYHPPKLRLFSGSEPTPCALARSAMGPFYCPRDQRVYFDISFFDDLQHKFGGCTNSNACEFSEAYAIARQVGHHVQDELGILPRVTQAQQASSSQAEANALQVRVELQADCFAGIWANHALQKNNFLDPGDVDQALQIASTIGDADASTHGTSTQRKRWFLNGFNSGKISDCNTFSANSLN